MKSLFLVSCLILVTVVTQAQTATKDTADQSCSFLKSLNFKKGKAIVVIKAYYKEFFRSPEESVLLQLSKKGYLNYSEYISMCCGGNAVDFIPEKCNKEYIATIKEGIKFDLNDFKPGNIFYLTCVVFEHSHGFKAKYFFVINDISLQQGK